MTLRPARGDLAAAEPRTGRGSPAARLSGRLVTVLVLQPLHGDHPLARRYAQHANPLGRPSRYADLIDGATYQLPRVCHHHDLVGFPDREAGDQFTIFRQTVSDEPLSASSRTAIVKRRCALAHASSVSVRMNCSAF